MALQISWFWTYSLWNSERINFYCFKHPVCAHLLWQPQETNIESVPSYFYSLKCLCKIRMICSLTFQLEVTNEVIWDLNLLCEIFDYWLNFFNGFLFSSWINFVSSVFLLVHIIIFNGYSIFSDIPFVILYMYCLYCLFFFLISLSEALSILLVFQRTFDIIVLLIHIRILF